jgi:hypothetical protein
MMTRGSERERFLGWFYITFFVMVVDFDGLLFIAMDGSSNVARKDDFPIELWPHFEVANENNVCRRSFGLTRLASMQKSNQFDIGINSFIRSMDWEHVNDIARSLMRIKDSQIGLDKLLKRRSPWLL